MKTMKKFVSLLLTASMMSVGSGLVNAAGLTLAETTKVNMENTETCFAKPTDEVYHADSNYYMHFKTSGEWLEVSQNLTEEAKAGNQYLMTVVAKPVTGTVWFRVGWDDSAWLSSGQMDFATDMGNGWYKYEKTVTMAANQSNFLFHSDGATEFYIDSISLVPVDGGNELLVNSSFNEVNYDASTDVITAKSTSVSANTENVFAKMLREEIVKENPDANYYMHFKTSGEWLEVSQNLAEEAKAGNQYLMTVVAKPVTGTVWFRVGWDDSGWLSSGQMDFATDMGDGWYKYEKTVTMAANQPNFLFHNDGATEFYIDSISLVPVDGENELLVNGSFNDVNYDATTGVTTAKSTSVSVVNSENIFATMLKEEMPEPKEYSLHFKATASDWLEVSQKLTEACTAGQYVLTLYAKPVTGRIWFRISWDDNGWLATHQSEFATLQPDGWYKYQKTITVDGEDDTTFLFHNEGDAEFYIDDISLVAVDGTKNLIPDGGFDEVNVSEDEPVVPAEKYEISEVVYAGLDADGKIKEGEVEVTATVTNNEMGEDFSPVMVVALYDGNQLKGFSYMEQTVAETAEYGLTIDVPAVSETSEYEIKVMFWDGLDTINTLNGVNTIR